MDRPRSERRALLSLPRLLARAALCASVLAMAFAASDGHSEDEPGPSASTPEAAKGNPTLRRVGRVRLDPEDIPEFARKKQLKEKSSPVGRKNKGNSAQLEAAYRAMKTGHYFRATVALDECNASGQRDPRVQELAGAAWSALGHYDEALGAFRIAASGPYYDELGIAAHADALRAFGWGAEAAAVRGALLLEPMELHEELNLMLELGDDYLYSGDGYGAEQVLLQAYAAFPRASVVHVALAEAYRLQGDSDSEEYHRWLAEIEVPGENFRELLTSAREALDEGRLHKAEEDILKLANRRRQNVQVGALRAELLIAQGTPEYAWSLLQNSYWRERADPELSAVRALALNAMGERARAEATLGEAQALYPAHPALLRAAAALQ